MDVAAAIVGNHAFNDFDGFIDSLFSGDGRSAARVSRSLYEHLVNYCEVMSSKNAAERYLAHRAVTADLLGDRTQGLPYLKGAQQKRERSRLAKLKRDSLKDLKSALAKFRQSLPSPLVFGQPVRSSRQSRVWRQVRHLPPSLTGDSR